MSQTESAFAAEVAAFTARYGTPSRVEVLLPDLRGRMRGKWMPGASLAKLGKAGVRLPYGTYALDIWGGDVEGGGLGAAIGDPDGICVPVPGTLQRGAPLADDDPDTVTAQVLVGLTMPDDRAEIGENDRSHDGGPCPYDPRHVLAKALEPYIARGLTPVCAVELEFYLFDASDPPNPAPWPRGSGKTNGPQVYDLDVTAAFAPVLDEIYAVARDAGIPCDAAIAEFGAGQFEIALHHVADALRAADDAMIFKHIVRRIAARHGLHATFMAKPLAEEIGSGCHVHMSILDETGTNIFSDQDGAVSDTLKHAIAGLLATAPDVQAVLAPNANSYRRFAPGSFSPVALCWGGDHRATAVRVPERAGPAARFEHRIAGADVNPYLLLTAILHGARKGMDDAAIPPEPVAPLTARATGERLDHDWTSALARFEKSSFARTAFGADLQRVYAHVSRDEQRRFAQAITPFEYDTYLPRL